MNFRTVSAAVCVACALGAGASIGYIGASSGGKAGALKIVSVDAVTGAVEEVGSLPVADATYIAVNRARTRLYTALSDAAFGGKGENGGVAVYAVDASGRTLTRLDEVGTTRGAPCHLSLSPDESRLVFAEYGRGTAGWIDLKADGTFAKESRRVVVSSDPVGPDASRQDRPHCHCARVTPDGKYTCVVDLGTDRVKIYARDGAFVRDLVTTPAGAGPRHLIFHPNGKLAFLLFELQNYVTSYRYSDGVFTPVRQCSLVPDGFTGFSKAAAIKLSADGRRLFCTNRGHNSLAVFDVDPATGGLSRRAILDLGADFPWDFEFMPGERILAVGFMKDRLLRTYRYDASACSITPVADVKDMGAIFCSTFFSANPEALPARGICAHRGNDGRQPENTVLAWANAVKLGAAMVELDVKRCATGELFVLHDTTVDRTTNGKGVAAKMSFAELRALDAGFRKGKKIPGCPAVKIPTFEEALDSIPRDAKVWINCHCAPNTAVEVAKTIQAKGRLHQAFIATSLKAIAEARKAVPGVLACNMSRTVTGLDAYRKAWPPEMSTLYARQTIEHGCQFLQLLAPCSKADAEMLHAAGVKIAYFHCEKPEKMKELVDLGVDFILTDNLVAMRDAFRELAK